MEEKDELQEKLSKVKKKELKKILEDVKKARDTLGDNPKILKIEENVVEIQDLDKEVGPFAIGKKMLGNLANNIIVVSAEIVLINKLVQTELSKNEKYIIMAAIFIASSLFLKTNDLSKEQDMELRRNKLQNEVYDDLNDLVKMMNKDEEGEENVKNR